ncbi:tRNA lysidine(34) synthetase TilS [Emticicia sp. C21]|uniref:tRNA lysidine(34) synthetase TilS n=1 Tax=Emticicia sp. C21 TaxID=2302915 RepID=UPI000E352D7C|nr:tRNA lysidine(34) synthetase TilS [Emticicia sp. C21]RFS16752.1 tRNA lysidine(34) synthetase TilS [Emticicia sp. C21]
MLQSFLTYINEQSLFQLTDKIVLAVSGGRDSIVLLDLFREAKFNFTVAHCNFQLRGEESDQDAEFVKELCASHGIPFRTTSFQTKDFAKTYKLSIEMAARQLRYEWFEQLRQELDYQYIATAHHLNDSIETILLNLTKGTGIAGLRGILPKKDSIIRPLLFAARTDIENYVGEKQLQWREDSSNASNDYQRNLLRNEVVPLLKKINPGLEHTFARNIERLQAIESNFQNNLDTFKESVCKEENGALCLKINIIQDWKSSSYLLEETLKEFGFNYFQSKEIHQSLKKTSGKTFYSATHTLIKDREYLIITPKQEKSFEEVFIEKGIQNIEYYDLFLHMSPATKEDWQAYLNTERKHNLLWVDASKLKYPLSIRPWQEGDWFIPLGMKGKKKISDFLVDKKVPLHLKKSTFLLCSSDDIVWVIGQRTDERFKITDGTMEVVRVEVLSV